MTEEQDVMHQLLDFENHGKTAGERVNLRERAAIEIFKARADAQHLREEMRKILRLDGTHDLPDAQKIARDALAD